MKSIDDTPRFVNQVLTWGTLNAVITLDLGVLLTQPRDDRQGVDVEQVIACRLRMDENCARDIIENLQKVLASMEAKRRKPQGIALEPEITEATRPN